jgi:hypothetical protein
MSIAGFLLATHALQCFGRESSLEPLDVCMAVKSRTTGLAVVRGTARLRADGLLVGDYTCAVAASIANVIPSMVLVDIQTFSSPEIRDRFNKLRGSSGHPPLLQVVVRGTLQCKQQLRFFTHADGETATADGYGDYGLAKCRMQKAELRFLYELE